MSAFDTALGPSMLSLALIIYFAPALLVTTFAIPTEYIPTVLTPKDAKPSTLPPLTLRTVLLPTNLTTTTTWRPTCWPDDPDLDPLGKANPITHPADCFQAVLTMFAEGPDRELFVWDRQRAWTYESCSLFLMPAPGLPIHRDTFSRDEIANAAETVRLECVNEEHGYRGGSLPIAAGVFQVGVNGTSISPSLGEGEEDIRLNATTLGKRALNYSGGSSWVQRLL